MANTYISTQYILISKNLFQNVNKLIL